MGINRSKYLVAISSVIVVSALASAEETESLKYNAMENRWENVTDDETLKYNAMEGEWEYATDSESPKYNAMENRWEMTEDDASIRYNPMDNSWSYEGGSNSSDDSDESGVYDLSGYGQDDGFGLGDPYSSDPYDWD